MAIESWAKSKVHGTWTDADGNRIGGRVETSISARLTSSVADVIIPAGKYNPGWKELNVTDLTKPSLSFDIPATDDDEIPETGWAVIIKVILTGNVTETYTLKEIFSGGDINLRQVIPDSVARPMLLGPTALKIGIPGGVALLDSNGYVLDGNGNAIVPSGSTTVPSDGGTTTPTDPVTNPTDATASQIDFGTYVSDGIV